MSPASTWPLRRVDCEKEQDWRRGRVREESIPALPAALHQTEEGVVAGGGRTESGRREGVPEGVVLEGFHQQPGRFR